MSGLLDRKNAALERKLAELETELAHWEEQSEPGAPLRLHQSQVQRLASVLRSLAGSIAAGRPAGGGNYSQRQLEMATLELHRIWEFFRSKLALRHTPWLRRPLDALDDFAWACYRPARDAAVASGHAKIEQVKEPPLVFFAGGWSPSAMPRGFEYDAETVPGEPVRTQAFIDVLQSLPVAVISLPWYQAAHLPDALAVAHEVGHLVQFDLGLTPRIEALVRDAVAPERWPAWRSWAAEVFADVYGQIAAGPLFVETLAEILVFDPATVAAERPEEPGWGDYPPTYLRMCLNFAVSRTLGYDAEAARLDAEWRNAFGATHAMTDYEPDLEELARRLVDGPYPELGGKRLPEIIMFGDALQRGAAAASNKLDRGVQPEADDVRALLVGGRRRFSAAPDRYTQATQELLLKAIDASRPAGVRGGGKATDHSRADTSLGEDLFRRLAEPGRARVRT